ncbi:MAG: hypothetical protein C0392_14530, partial [Syntrophus sp. (in: bacteria)]|nr:hypothetical protein [Syntrophus sp. (in: bacteria)]
LNPLEDTISKTDIERSEDPEAGSGVKYMVEKRLRLKGGEKNLFFGLPEEEYCTDIRIRVLEGKENSLEFKPVYRKGGTRHIRNFKYGIEDFEVFLSGNQIQ